MSSNTIEEAASSSSSSSGSERVHEQNEPSNVLEDPLNLHNPSPDGQRRGQNWIVTLWGVTPDDVKRWGDAQKGQIKWIVACTDKGELTERDHIHIAVGFKQRIYFTTWQSWFGRQQHYELTRDKNQAIAYVNGEGRHKENKEVFLSVNLPPVSQRTVRRIKQHDFWSQVQRMQDIIELDELIQREGYENYIPQIRAAREFLLTTRNIPRMRETKRQVIWIYGPRGNGKSYLLSKFADTHAPSADCSFSKSNAQLICTKNDMRTAIFDDIDIKGLNKPLLFNLLDNYNIVVDKKFGAQLWRPDWVIITSIMSPFEIGQDEGYNSNEKEQIIRRLTHLIKANLNPATGERSYEYSTIERVLDQYKPSQPDTLTFEEIFDILDTSLFRDQ